MKKTDEEKLESYLRSEEKQRIGKAKAVKKYMAVNQAMRLFNSAKQRAKLQGLEFSLSVDDLVIPAVCPYIGCPITNDYGVGRVWTNASIDRIDSSKGYVKGNIQILSDLANRMKQNATPEQLVAFAKGVMKVHAGIETT